MEGAGRTRSPRRAASAETGAQGRLCLVVPSECSPPPPGSCLCVNPPDISRFVTPLPPTLLRGQLPHAGSWLPRVPGPRPSGVFEAETHALHRVCSDWGLREPGGGAALSGGLSGPLEVGQSPIVSTWPLTFPSCHHTCLSCRVGAILRWKCRNGKIKPRCQM